ncbi:hypothetical protein KSS87_005426 [Heliosperma pusillum]|nr:hypothetical protein KSS87_005426 [Heliosperma pusillum]
MLQTLRLLDHHHHRALRTPHVAPPSEPSRFIQQGRAPFFPRRTTTTVVPSSAVTQVVSPGYQHRAALLQARMIIKYVYCCLLGYLFECKLICVFINPLILVRLYRIYESFYHLQSPCSLNLRHINGVFRA